jgi:hypothetical protein
VTISSLHDYRPAGLPTTFSTGGRDIGLRKRQRIEELLGRDGQSSVRDPFDEGSG